MKTLLVVVLLLMPSIGAAKKQRAWIPGTVLSVEQVPGRAMQDMPANYYVIRTDTADYTLEHAAGTYYQSIPKPLLGTGDAVQFSLDGKYAIVKTAAFEKRLRMIKSSVRAKDQK